MNVFFSFPVVQTDFGGICKAGGACYYSLSSRIAIVEWSESDIFTGQVNIFVLVN